jgi:hemoglobin
MILAGALTLGVSCTKNKDEAASAAANAKNAAGEKTLYERLGREEGIRAVVKDFVQRGANNRRVNFVRAGHPNQWEPTPRNAKVLEDRLVEFIAQNTGGPQKYRGQDMPSAHAGMRISEQEFDALAGDLKASLDHFKVPEQEQQELLEIVGSTKPDIVGK